MKLLKGILFFTVLFTCVFIIETIRKKTVHENIINKYKKLELYSIVLNKYEDSSRYHYDTIIIHNLISQKDTVLRSHYNKSDLFTIVQIGDTLIKESGTMNIKIKNLNRFKYDYSTSFIFEEF